MNLSTLAVFRPSEEETDSPIAELEVIAIQMHMQGKQTASSEHESAQEKSASLHLTAGE